MKIAISSTGPDLESEVDPRFGRCQYFLIADLDNMSFETVAKANIARGSGVGIQSAKVVADKGAKALLTGNVGPNAYPWGHGPRTERGLGGCNPRRRSFELQGQARARFGARQGRARGRRLDIRTGQAQVFGGRHLGQ